MRHPSYRGLRGGIGIFAGALVLSASGFAPSAPAGAVTATGPVSTSPASGTPQLAKTSTTQVIRQLVQCGSMMYAVGSFTKISQGGRTFTRNGVFSFKATAPYTVSDLKVGVNGEVNTIAFTRHRGCADAYIGGSFTTVHGTSARNIAEVNTSTGAVVPTFGRNANNTVYTMVGYQNHLLTGGKFTKTNGHSRNRYASLNPFSGKDDGFLRLRVSGHVSGNPAQVYNQQLSHSGNLLLVEGNFTSVGGHSRQQIFMANLSGTRATVTGWTSPEFSKHCVTNEAFYVRAAAWSPGDSTVYTASTGFHPLNWVKGTFPLTGLCDTVAAFPATHKSVSHKWINYSGCDSYFSVHADSGAVYAAGHPRWAENPNGCNNAGPGAIKDHGLQGFDPSNGKLELRSDGRPRYNMSRANADDMLITSAGLWIASTNRFGDNSCQSVGGHAGICFLPY
jgi:hypothetical protein